MIKINLLSEGKRPTAVRKTRKAAISLEGKEIGQWLLVTGIVVGILAVGFYWWTLRQRLEEVRSEVSAAEAEVARLASVIKEVEDYKQKKAELERKIGIINDLKANQRGPVRVMDYVSRALPELLWLDRVRMEASNIEVEGRAFNTNAVANFIENLDKVPEFEEPTLKDTTQQGGGVYKFVISFNYSFSPAKAETEEAGAAGAAPAPAATGRTTG
jgi:type IV pilus assembly protein PilN